MVEAAEWRTSMEAAAHLLGMLSCVRWTHRGSDQRSLLFKLEQLAEKIPAENRDLIAKLKGIREEAEEAAYQLVRFWNLLGKQNKVTIVSV